MPRDINGRFKTGKPIPHKSGCGCFRCTKITWNKGKPWNEEVRKKISIANTGKVHPETQGENNVHWKGDGVGYMALHGWITKKKGRPKKCTECGETKHLVWANKSFEYKRDLDDWISLCHKCHMARDAKDGWGIALKRFPDLKKYYDSRRKNKKLETTPKYEGAI